jgi:3-oxoacyl-[acyl-carrier protein] reductase
LLAHIAPADIERIVAVNLTAPILLTRAAVKRMIVAGAGGRIVNISSICAVRGYSGLAVYSATKGALEAFTRALAREVGERGVMVNAVAPGFFSSEMSAVLAADQIETGRLSTPEDVVPAVLYLLFDAANVTGQVLTVDGGSSV